MDTEYIFLATITFVAMLNIWNSDRRSRMSAEEKKQDDEETLDARFFW